MNNENNETMRKENQPHTNTGFRGLYWKQRVPLFDNKSSATRETHAQENEGTRENVRISRDSEDMLAMARRKPHLCMTSLYKAVGLSSYKGKKCREELKQAHLADEVELPTNRRGRRKKLLQIMPKGTAYLKAIGITQGPRGRGGVKHIYYQKNLKEWYEVHGYTAEVEATIGTTCLDLLIILNDATRLGIEIALSEQYEEINAVNALGAGIERLLVVCESETVMERIQRKVDSTIQGQTRTRIGFKLVSDYFGND